MKKALLIFAAVAMGVVAGAQEPKRFTLATAVGTGIDMATPASTPFIWQVTGYYNLNERFSVGAGTGLSFYEKLLVPLFADARFMITRPRKFTPFLECGAGYGFAPGDDANGGLYLNPSVGLQFSIRDNRKLFVALGYELQKLERLKTYRGPFFTAGFTERLNHNLIAVRIGFSFSSGD